ncbi:reverse transcriptase domain-containing protein [Tanacetum coccineum]
MDIIRGRASDMGSQPSHGRVPLGILPKVLPRRLQRLPSDLNGRRRRGQDNILRRRRSLLLLKDALLFKKHKRNISKTSRQAPIHGEVLMMYLAASTESISTALFTRREEGHVPIYFGIYAAKQPAIKEYLQRTKETLRRFNNYTIEHIRRNQNKKADSLSKLALMTFKYLTKELLVEVLVRRSIEEKEVLQVETKEEESWMTPIYEYLLSGLLLEDSKVSRNIRNKAPQYKLIRGNLYKKSFYTPWLHGIAPPKTNDVIKEIHEGSCGFNMEPCSMVVRITKQGYYWPLMHRDVARIIQDCKK